MYLSQFYGISDLFSTVHFYTFLDAMVMMTYVSLVLMGLYIWIFYHGIYYVFYRITQAVGHNYNSPVDPTVYARLREPHISRHDWRGCRGGKKLHRKVGDVGNGPDKATYDGHEGVNQSDTVSIHAVAHGQSIPTRFLASADPHAIHSPGVHPLAIKQTLYVNNQCLHV